MTDHAASPPIKSSRALLPIVGAAMALITTLISWRAAGATLGLLIASLTFAALIAAPLTVIEQGVRPRLLITAAIVAGIAVAWLFAFVPSVGVPPVLAMLTVLATFVLMVSGVAIVLARVRIDPTLASAIAIVLTMAWLSWPIWLSSHLSEGRLIATLVVTHPIFALNGTSETLGVWTQQHLMYRLTALGQDVPFAVPRSVLPCALAHGLLGVICWTIGKTRRAPTTT